MFLVFMTNPSSAQFPMAIYKEAVKRSVSPAITLLIGAESHNTFENEPNIHDPKSITLEDLPSDFAYSLLEIQEASKSITGAKNLTELYFAMLDLRVEFTKILKMDLPLEVLGEFESSLNELEEITKKIKSQFTIVEFYHPEEVIDQEAEKLNSINWTLPNGLDPNCFSDEPEPSYKSEQEKMDKTFSITDLIFAYFTKHSRYETQFFSKAGGFIAKSSLGEFISKLPKKYFETCFFEIQYRTSDVNRSKFTGTAIVPLKNTKCIPIDSKDGNGNPGLEIKVKWLKLDNQNNLTTEIWRLPETFMEREKQKDFIRRIEIAKECCPNVGL